MGNFLLLRKSVLNLFSRIATVYLIFANIFTYDRTGSNNCAISNPYTTHYSTIRANPNVVTYNCFLYLSPPIKNNRYIRIFKIMVTTYNPNIPG